MEPSNQPKVGLTLVLVLTISLTGAARQRGQDIESHAQTRTLANGLTIVVVERPGTATFGGMLGCKAGTVDDPPGGAGTAHLVEHFLAGPTIGLIGPPKALLQELTQEYEKTGGADSPRSKALEAEIAAARKGPQQWNIGTVQDFVFYGVMTYPAAGLDRFLETEAETMKAVPSGFIETQRQVLIDEITKTITKDVANQTANPNLATAFSDHPYGAPIGGVPSDVAAMTLDSVRAFKQAYYTPGRCIVAIVGEVSPAAVFSTADRLFGDIPKSVPRPETPPRPVVPGERRRTVESIAGPRLLLSFRKPPPPSRDDAVAEVVASLLGRGAESRLPRDLTASKKLTASVTAGNGGPGLRYDNLLTIGAVPAAGVRVQDLEAPILKHLEALKTEPVGGDELSAAIARLDASRDALYAADFPLALAIARHHVALGDWKAVLKAREAYRTVSAEEVMAFARKCFTPENRAVVTLVKENGE
jgi:zinc protease